MRVKALALSLLIACYQVGPLPPKRADEVTTRAPLAGVVVKIAPASYTGWRVLIENQRVEQLTLLWDESSFVTGDRRVTGRLIRGYTKLISSDKPQPGSPIPPGATLAELATPEGLLYFKPPTGTINNTPQPQPALNSTDEDRDCVDQYDRCVAAKQLEECCARKRSACRTAIGLPDDTAPKRSKAENVPLMFARGVGRIVLVFEGPKGRETWESWVSFDGTTPPLDEKPVAPSEPTRPPIE